jgi:hypothetical protein
MSANQRPSSSRKYSIAREKPVGDFGITPSCHRFADRGNAQRQRITRDDLSQSERAYAAAVSARKEEAVALVASVTDDERSSNGSTEFDASVGKHGRFSRRPVTLSATGVWKKR